MTRAHRPRSAALLAAALLVLAPPWLARGEEAQQFAPQALPVEVPAPEPVPTISIDEVERGMRGWGLSVFAGREPERFEAEVIGVLRNTSPDTSFILAKLSGHGLEDSGVPGGMSGSPVYLDGRLAGAVAFAWPFSQQAVAGITPIDKMRQLAAGGGAAGAMAVAGGAPAEPPVPLADLVAGKVPADLLERELARLRPQLTAGAVPGVQWAASGFGERGEALLGRSLGGVVPMGVAAGATGAAGEAPAAGELVPGGAVAAVLVDGDLRLAATGTVTDRTGDQVLAFGHPFLGLGPLEVPMATAEVVTVLASDYSSFKISNLGATVGAFEQDRQAGIYGRVGREAHMLPVTVRIEGQRDYRMRVARVPRITPALIAIAALAGLDSASYTGGLQGVDLTARFRIAGHGDLEVRQSFDGEGAASAGAGFLLSFASYLMGNDLAEVEVESVEVELAQVGKPRTATLVGAHAERSVVRPGDTVALNLDFTAWRGEKFRHRVEIGLPEDLPRGRYYLFVGDGASVDAARLAVERSAPASFRQALDLLRSLHSRRELLVLGVAAGPGLAVAGEAMPNLPGTVRSIWSAAPAGSATPLRLAVTQQQVEAMPVPLSGLARVDLEVERREPLRASVDGGAGGGETDGGEGDAGGDGGAEGEPAAAASGTAAGGDAGDGGGESGR
jgi:hypothetical protein